MQSHGVDGIMYELLKEEKAVLKWLVTLLNECKEQGEIGKKHV